MPKFTSSKLICVVGILELANFKSVIINECFEKYVCRKTSVNITTINNLGDTGLYGRMAFVKHCFKQMSGKYLKKDEMVHADKKI